MRCGMDLFELRKMLLSSIYENYAFQDSRLYKLDPKSNLVTTSRAI